MSYRDELEAAQGRIEALELENDTMLERLDETNDREGKLLLEIRKMSRELEDRQKTILYLRARKAISLLGSTVAVVMMGVLLVLEITGYPPHPPSYNPRQYFGFLAGICSIAFLCGWIFRKGVVEPSNDITSQTTRNRADDIRR